MNKPYHIIVQRVIQRHCRSVAVPS